MIKVIKSSEDRSSVSGRELEKKREVGEKASVWSTGPTNIICSLPTPRHAANVNIVYKYSIPICFKIFASKQILLL